MNQDIVKGLVLPESRDLMTTERAKLIALPKNANSKRAVCIWVERFFTPTASKMRADDYLSDWRTNKLVVFDSVWEAYAWIDDTNLCNYYLSGGEYARPVYYVVPRPSRILR